MVDLVHEADRWRLERIVLRQVNATAMIGFRFVIEEFFELLKARISINSHLPDTAFVRCALWTEELHAELVKPTEDCDL